MGGWRRFARQRAAFSRQEVNQFQHASVLAAAWRRRSGVFLLPAHQPPRESKVLANWVATA